MNTLDLGRAGANRGFVRTRAGIDVNGLARTLSGTGEWSAAEWDRAGQLIRKLEVSGRLDREYAPNWRARTDATPLTSAELVRVVPVFLAGARRAQHRGLGAKCLNAAFRALDLVRVGGVPPVELEREADALLDSLDVPVVSGSPWDAAEPGASSTMATPRTLPLTVLVHEGPQARAYLLELARRGLRVARILHLVRATQRATGRPLGRWLPTAWRTRYALCVGEVAEFHWPRRLRSQCPALFDAVLTALTPVTPDPRATIEALVGSFDYAAFADRYDRCLVDDLRDPRLAATLRDLAPGTVLFTGGGIVPRTLLEVPGLRFLHVHPGTLPAVRGADGLLWSVWLRGRPGCSAFFMDAGIDTGDLIAAADAPPIEVSLPNASRPSSDLLYRSVFSYIDPLLRARFLCDHVLPNPPDDLRDLPARPQRPTDGQTYHFMHPRLRERALAHIFRSSRTAEHPDRRTI
ncbi:MAG: formyltransferase family protein [Planctomycetota bacterium]